MARCSAGPPHPSGQSAAAANPPESHPGTPISPAQAPKSRRLGPDLSRQSPQNRNAWPRCPADPQIRSAWAPIPRRSLDPQRLGPDLSRPSPKAATPGPLSLPPIRPNRSPRPPITPTHSPESQPSGLPRRPPGPPPGLLPTRARIPTLNRQEYWDVKVNEGLTLPPVPALRLSLTASPRSSSLPGLTVSLWERRGNPVRPMPRPELPPQL
jgi:hypothetical protein